jgi:hypothetical protein
MANLNSIVATNASILQRALANRLAINTTNSTVTTLNTNVSAIGVEPVIASCVFTYDTLANDYRTLTIVETTDAGTRTTTNTYLTSGANIGKLNTVAVTFGGVTKTLTYVYDANGNVASYSIA